MARFLPIWILLFMALVAWLIGPCGRSFAQDGGIVYRATIVRVVDGDTVDLFISVPVPWGRAGMFLVVPERVRICCIDTPESSKPRAKCEQEIELGKKAEEYLTSILKPMSKVLLSFGNNKYDKYGRVLAKVAILNGQDVGTIMIDAGLARPYYGRKKSDWCSEAKSEDEERKDHASGQ